MVDEVDAVPDILVGDRGEVLLIEVPGGRVAGGEVAGVGRQRVAGEDLRIAGGADLVDDEFAFRELPLPATREMPFDVPVRLACVEPWLINVGVLGLHADVKDVPLNRVLKNFGKVVLTHYGFDLPTHERLGCLLEVCGDVIPLVESFL